MDARRTHRPAAPRVRRSLPLSISALWEANLSTPGSAWPVPRHPVWGRCVLRRLPPGLGVRPVPPRRVSPAVDAPRVAAFSRPRAPAPCLVLPFSRAGGPSLPCRGGEAQGRRGLAGDAVHGDPSPLSRECCLGNFSARASHLPAVGAHPTPVGTGIWPRCWAVASWRSAPRTHDARCVSAFVMPQTSRHISRPRDPGALAGAPEGSPPAGPSSPAPAGLLVEAALPGPRERCPPGGSPRTGAPRTWAWAPGCAAPRARLLLPPASLPRSERVPFPDPAAPGPPLNAQDLRPGLAPWSRWQKWNPRREGAP